MTYFDIKFGAFVKLYCVCKKNACDTGRGIAP